MYINIYMYKYMYILTHTHTHTHTHTAYLVVNIGAQPDQLLHTVDGFGTAGVVQRCHLLLFMRDSM